VGGHTCRGPGRVKKGKNNRPTYITDKGFTKKRKGEYVDLFHKKDEHPFLNRGRHIPQGKKNTKGARKKDEKDDGGGGKVKAK